MPAGKTRGHCDTSILFYYRLYQWKRHDRLSFNLIRNPDTHAKNGKKSDVIPHLVSYRHSSVLTAPKLEIILSYCLKFPKTRQLTTNKNIKNLLGERPHSHLSALVLIENVFFSSPYAPLRHLCWLISCVSKELSCRWCGGRSPLGSLWIYCSSEGALFFWFLKGTRRPKPTKVTRNVGPFWFQKDML